MAKIEVKTRKGKVSVDGGKKVTTDNTKGFADGQEITTFRTDEHCDFKYNEGGEHAKHLSEAGKTVKMHVLDAAIAEKIGKGKIVEGSAARYRELAKAKAQAKVSSGS